MGVRFGCHDGWTKYGGKARVVIKSDGEPAIVKLKADVARARRAEGNPTMPEESPTGESQSNSKAERTIREVEGICRTIKVSMERMYRVRIPAQHDSVAWMVKWAGESTTWFRQGSDGQTAYQRRRGSRVS